VDGGGRGMKWCRSANQRRALKPRANSATIFKVLRQVY